ncbi:GNAT family protein [Psychromarinibacter sp. C21-152]|uniref:GNAT family protein n=1 Tax=Psychromarinibacter sediminicola TaxID=3033385 RepID=A0AAE3NQN9_9RHOB|nr:GNAT family protein [Psychromarinibacter sediminicola]MDF0599175.1 GNAT family protein [Psychromarinibacter sediminicola]
MSTWTPPRRPDAAVLEGRYARLERLRPDHAPALFAANAESDAIWDWLPYGPFGDLAAYRDWMTAAALGADPRFYAIRDRQADAWGGVASYLRIAPEAGTIEVGHINFAPRLQKTRAATEAMLLMMRWAFEAGYRRYEWKCNARNLGSRRAAQRLGFSFEGVFRQAAVVKGRNRDTAWFACIDKEWPALRAAFDAWLDPANFDAQGRQRQSLSALTAPIRVASDPALG